MGANIPFRQLSPFGVEIELDLSQPLAAAEVEQLRELLDLHSLILVRGQQLDLDQHREFCSNFGPVLLRAGEDGYITNQAGALTLGGLIWHANSAYTDHPFDALSLHAIDVVDDETSTRFVSAELAYDLLPSRLHAALTGVDQQMLSPDYKHLEGRTCDRRDPAAFEWAIQPALLENPHSGRKAIWVNEMQTVRLLGMEWEASRDVLHEVFDHLYSPEHMLVHRWRNGDLLLWDNYALQHSRDRIGNVGRRVHQRVIIGTKGALPHLAREKPARFQGRTDYARIDG